MSYPEVVQAVAVELPHIPIAQAYPEFASIAPLEVPAELKGAVSPELWGLIQSSASWTIRQHVKILPKSVCSL